MPGTLRTSRLAAAYYEMMQRHLLPHLPKWGVTPNRLTWLGMLISVLVPMGFWAHPVWGFLLILISGAADSLDGLMARQQNRLSLWGSFLDSSLDRISDFFYLLGFWVLFSLQTGQVPATLAIFVSMLLTFMISYIKARAEALGCNCPVGLMERGARTGYLITWALVLVLAPSGRAVLLWLGLLLYGVLTFMTVFQRWTFIARQMRDRLPPP
jgi:CDP-diacylglycerol--glycerol-3-phosphate 3-phosphatidyltransferase